MAYIRELLAELGFSRPREVEGLTSIRRIWSSRTSGLYVLHFSDGSYYVGRSIRVVRRFAEHQRNHSDITHISFSQTARANQDGAESKVITRLQSAGFPLRNIDKVLQISGPSGFDEVMESSRQAKWLTEIAYVDRAGDRFEDHALRARYRARFQELLHIPGIDKAIEIARMYVQSCIPAYVRSEKHFWQVSALPTSAPGVIIRVNAGWQLTFDVLSNEHGFLTYRWFLRRDQAEEIVGAYLHDLQTDGHAHWLQLNDQQGVEYNWYPSTLVKGGADQVIFAVFSADDAASLLSDEILVSVAREYSLHLLRQSKTPYGRYHCLDLADRLVEP